jgi:hypothetical protein
MAKKSGSGSGIRNEQPGSYFLELRNHFFEVKILKFFDTNSRLKKFGSKIRDGKKSDLGSGIRKKIPGSATLPIIVHIPVQQRLN